MNGSIAQGAISKEFEIRYKGQPSSFEPASTKPVFLLPSQGYKIFPTPLQYDQYKIGKDDEIRKTLLKVAQASNLTFHGLGTCLKLPNPRVLEDLMMRYKVKASPEINKQFINAIKSLRKQKKIREDNSTRISAPDAPLDVVFLYEGFSLRPFKGMEILSESEPDAEMPDMAMDDTPSLLPSAPHSESEEINDDEQGNNDMNDLPRTGIQPVPDSGSHEPSTVLTRSGHRVTRPVIESFEWSESDE